MLKDGPVDVTAEVDLLGQRSTIATLVASIERMPPPACIALYGAWGSGKTNILHNARNAIESALHVPVWFDPWRYDQQPDLLGPLIRALLVRVRARHGHLPGERKRRFIGAASALARMLGALSLRVGTRVALNGLLPLPEGVADPVASGDTGKMSLEEWLAGKGDPQDEVEQIRTRFATLVEAALELEGEGGVPPANHRVVFFLDDLDRCLPHRAVELIEKIKLLLCGSPRCRAVFVFALDRRIVGEAVRHQFAGSSHATGENYLEKIFDLALEAPPVPAEPARVEAFVEACAAQLGGLEALCRPFGGPQPLLSALTLPALANPRVIKRTLNRLSLLVADPERVDALEDMDDPGQCLAWLAGAERYRLLRKLLRSGEVEVVKDVVRRLDRRESAPVTGLHARLLALPGLDDFLAQVEIRNHQTSFKALTEGFGRSAGRPPVGSLRWFDDLMHGAGL